MLIHVARVRFPGAIVLLDRKVKVISNWLAQKLSNPLADINPQLGDDIIGLQLGNVRSIDSRTIEKYVIGVCQIHFQNISNGVKNLGEVVARQVIARV